MPSTVKHHDGQVPVAQKNIRRLQRRLHAARHDPEHPTEVRGSPRLRLEGICRVHQRQETPCLAAYSSIASITSPPPAHEPQTSVSAPFLCSPPSRSSASQPVGSRPAMRGLAGEELLRHERPQFGHLPHAVLCASGMPDQSRKTPAILTSLASTFLSDTSGLLARRITCPGEKTPSSASSQRHRPPAPRRSRPPSATTSGLSRRGRRPRSVADHGIPPHPEQKIPDRDGSMASTISSALRQPHRAAPPGSIPAAEYRLPKSKRPDGQEFKLPARPFSRPPRMSKPIPPMILSVAVRLLSAACFSTRTRSGDRGRLSLC